MKRTRNILVTIILGLAILLPAPVSAASGNINRLDGRTRVETSIAVSKETYPDGSSSDVVLAGYHGEADALTGTLLASSKDAPLLLIHKFDQTMQDEFKRLGAKTIHLLGGEVALSKSLENEIKAAGYTVKRVAGKGRFATAVQVASASSVTTDHAFLTNDGRSGSLADALAIGPVSGREKDPILLTSKDKLPTETLNALDEMNIKKITIVGGAGAVSENIRATLENKNIQVKRIAGYNRWNTAEKIANQYFSGTEEAIVANDGRIGNFADALMGGYLGAKKDAPILLTQAHQMNNETKTFLINQVSNVYLLGGTSVVQSEVSDTINNILIGGGLGDIEPNDSFGTANPVKIGNIIKGSIDQNDDPYDYFRVTVPIHGHLKLTTTTLKDVRMLAVVYDENHNEISSSMATSTNSFNLGVKPGTYYLRLGGSKASDWLPTRTASYEISSSFTPSIYTDEEAGDRFTKAKKIDLNDHIKGTIGYGHHANYNAADYFKVEVEEEGVFEAVLRMLDGGTKWFTIYDENERKIAAKSGSNNTIRLGLKPGTYYIRVSRYMETAESYDLVTSFTPSLNVDEGAGNHFIHAKEIDIDKEINGTIGYGHGNNHNNRDYFKVELPSAGTLDVEINALENRQIHFRFFDKNRKELDSHYWISKKTIRLEVAPGTHYILIESNKDDYGSYNMTTSFNP